MDSWVVGGFVMGGASGSLVRFRFFELLLFFYVYVCFSFFFCSFFCCLVVFWILTVIVFVWWSTVGWSFSWSIARVSSGFWRFFCGFVFVGSRFWFGSWFGRFGGGRRRRRKMRTRRRRRFIVGRRRF